MDNSRMLRQPVAILSNATNHYDRMVNKFVDMVWIKWGVRQSISFWWFHHSGYRTGQYRKSLQRLSHGILELANGDQEATLSPTHKIIGYFHMLWDALILRVRTIHPELYRYFRNQGSFQKVFPFKYDDVIWHATDQLRDITYCRKASYLALQIIDFPLSSLERQNSEPLLPLACALSDSFEYDDPYFYYFIHDHEDPGAAYFNF